MTRLSRLPAFDADDRLQAVIESPQGTRNKLKYEPASRTFVVTESLPAGSNFPFDFGFIPSTRGPDGDPLDILVLMDAPAFPGCIVKVRLLGVIEAEQAEQGAEPYRNDRLVAMAEGSTERGDPRRLSDLEPHLVEQIEAFFESYNALRKTSFRVIARKGPPTARRLVEAGRK